MYTTFGESLAIINSVYGMKHDENAYQQHLRKVERVKFEMAENYRLHPCHYIIKTTKQHDFIRSNNLLSNYSGSNETLVDWDETRIDVIAQNGNEGLHYETNI